MKLNQCQGVWVEGLRASGAWDNAFDCVACQVGGLGCWLRKNLLHVQCHRHSRCLGCPAAETEPCPGALSSQCACSTRRRNLCLQYGHILNSRFSDSEWGLYLKGGSGERAAGSLLPPGGPAQPG